MNVNSCYTHINNDGGLKMIKLVLLRHGESLWNQKNRFTGWTDVDLSEKGLCEAKEAGECMMKEGLSFDIAYTSFLKRAIRTLWEVLDVMDLMWLPVYRDWRLNERHYGALQGLNKAETAAKYGEEQVLIWRRSFDIRPPALEKTDVRYPGYDMRYKHLGEDQLPTGECLKDTIDRFLPLWHDLIVKDLKQNKKVLIVAHGNSLRALVKHLDKISEEEIVHLNIPTGMPLVYELDDDLKPIQHYYLGNPDAVKTAMKNVENQGKAR